MEMNAYLHLRTNSIKSSPWNVVNCWKNAVWMSAPVPLSRIRKSRPCGQWRAFSISTCSIWNRMKSRRSLMVWFIIPWRSFHALIEVSEMIRTTLRTKHRAIPSSICRPGAWSRPLWFIFVRCSNTSLLKLDPLNCRMNRRRRLKWKLSMLNGWNWTNYSASLFPLSPWTRSTRRMSW